MTNIFVGNAVKSTTHSTCLIVCQPDADMCEFCAAELSLTLISHSYANL